MGSYLGGVALGGSIVGGARHAKHPLAGHHAKKAHHAPSHHAVKQEVKKELKSAARHESKEKLARELPVREVLKLVPKGKLEKKVVAKELRGMGF